jgi:FlaA1/EpsC-like NDP-sugar epimerase
MLAQQGGTVPRPNGTSFFAGKRVIVTGGGGSVGTELVLQLLDAGVGLVRVVDNNESGLFALGERLAGTGRFEGFCCDIRDDHELNRTFSGMEICFHAAALKHVPSCEASPFSAVQTNIIGTQQVIRAALRNQLSRVLFTSSDKAVNPTNVMGTSKLMGGFRSPRGSCRGERPGPANGRGKPAAFSGADIDRARDPRLGRKRRLH